MVESVKGSSSILSGEMVQVSQPLTDEQKSKVQSILSDYDSSKLTNEDAKSIFQSFREAGIRPGAGLRDAITSAGFDAEKLRTLAKPDGRHTHKQNSVSTSTSDGEIDTTALKSLQSILNQFDLTNLSADEQKDLLTQLNDAGLMQSGNIIDLSA